jgi:hypothetical protein
MFLFHTPSASFLSLLIFQDTFTYPLKKLPQHTLIPIFIFQQTAIIIALGFELLAFHIWTTAPILRLSNATKHMCDKPEWGRISSSRAPTGGKPVIIAAVLLRPASIHAAPAELLAFEDVRSAALVFRLADAADHVAVLPWGQTNITIIIIIGN